MCYVQRTAPSPPRTASERARTLRSERRGGTIANQTIIYSTERRELDFNLALKYLQQGAEALDRYVRLRRLVLLLAIC